MLRRMPWRVSSELRAWQPWPLLRFAPSATPSSCVNPPITGSDRRPLIFRSRAAPVPACHVRGLPEELHAYSGLHEAVPGRRPCPAGKAGRWADGGMAQWEDGKSSGAVAPARSQLLTKSGQEHARGWQCLQIGRGPRGLDRVLWTRASTGIIDEAVHGHRRISATDATLRAPPCHERPSGDVWMVLGLAPPASHLFSARRTSRERHSRERLPATCRNTSGTRTVRACMQASASCDTDCIRGLSFDFGACCLARYLSFCTCTCTCAPFIVAATTATHDCDASRHLP